MNFPVSFRVVSRDMKRGSERVPETRSTLKTNPRGKSQKTPFIQHLLGTNRLQTILKKRNTFEKRKTREIIPSFKNTKPRQNSTAHLPIKVFPRPRPTIATSLFICLTPTITSTNNENEIYKAETFIREFVQVAFSGDWTKISREAQRAEGWQELAPSSDQSRSC